MVVTAQDQFTVTASEGLPTVAIDESGNTGPNLLDDDQPVFTLASTNLTEEEARAILEEIDLPPEREPKFKSLANSNPGRKKLLGVFESPVVNAKRVKIARVHKRYMLAGKLFDVLAEPTLHRRGIDAQQGKANIRAAEILLEEGPRACGQKLWSALESTFIHAARAPEDQEAVEALTHAIGGVRRASRDELLTNIIDLMPSTVEGVGSCLRLPDDTHQGSLLDPSLTVLIALLDYWNRQHDRYHVLHDRSKLIEWELANLLALHDPDTPGEEIGPGDDRTIMIPGNAAGLELVDSSQYPQVQIADLLAGACSVWSMPRGRFDDFARRLTRLGIADLIHHEIWPPGLPASPRLWDWPTW